MKNFLSAFIAASFIVFSITYFTGCGNSAQGYVEIPIGSCSYYDEANKVTLYYSPAFFSQSASESEWYLYLPSLEDEDTGLRFWTQTRASSPVKWENADEAKRWYEENFNVTSSSWKNGDPSSDTFIVLYTDSADESYAHADMVKIDGSNIYYAAVLCFADDAELWYKRVENTVYIVTDGTDIKVVP